MPSLPPDILVLVCEELGYRRDFQTLFNCALTGRPMVWLALRWLYRIHSYSTVINNESSDVEISHNSPLSQMQMLQKWALQWKSIIRSSLGNTIYPYCLYIRSLDLRNLGELLDDPLFRDNVMEIFFANDMAWFLRFHKSQDTDAELNFSNPKNMHSRLDITKILELVGESITTHICRLAANFSVTVAVEDLSGNIQAEALSKWARRLTNLKSMTLWDGSALNQDTAKAILSGCPSFNDLTFYTCLNPHADHELGLFFEGLRPNSLQSFTALSANAIGTKTLLSLNHHARSLRYLKLDGLKSDAIRRLSLLQACQSLVSLEIIDSEGLVSLEKTEADVFIDIIHWICSCHGLRELLMRNLVDAPEILTHVCLNDFVQLKRLQAVRYPLIQNQNFHKALSHQISLESLELNADPEGAGQDDIDILVSSVAQLTNLRYLNLLSTSDYFSTHAIVSLVSSLSRLEELTFGGYDITDDFWDAVTNLPYLRALNIHAISSFSFDGILAYVDALHDTNKGMLLSVMSQTPDNPITYGEQSIIRQSLAANVGGTFDFTLFREPESDTDFSD